MASCNRKIVFDRYQSTDIEGWEKNDTLIFCVPPVAEAGVYKEEVGLRINAAYPFTGLSLVVEQTLHPANVTRRDTLNCRLITDKGSVKGRGVVSYQYAFHLTNITLVPNDSLTVRIHHNMRREILPGISDVGIRLTNDAPAPIRDTTAPSGSPKGE